MTVAGMESALALVSERFSICNQLPRPFGWGFCLWVWRSVLADCSHAPRARPMGSR
jgi:hypothetical protein